MSTTSSAAGRAPERRMERRIAVHRSMKIRGTSPDGVRFEEITVSENLCRNGAAFATWHPLDLGEEVEILIPMPKQKGAEESDFATRGRVIHVAVGQGKRERIVGVEFTGPRFHKVFIPESS